MSRTSRHVLVDIDDAYRVISDPTTYPRWLVGARDIRAVDEGWPDTGTSFHHRVGLLGPLTVPDSTTSVESDPPRLLVMEVRARPFIRARVRFELEDVGTGDRPRTRITMDEVPIGPYAPLQPVLDPLTDKRNAASLNALVAHLNGPRS